MEIDRLIDGEGKQWEASSPKLRARLGLAGVDFDLPAYVIRNLGYVGIRAGGAGSTVRIVFRPRMLRVATLDALAWTLTTGSFARHVIEPIGQSARVEIIADLEDAVARLVYLGDQSGSLAHPSYFAQRLSLNRLAAPKLVALDNMLAIWKSTRGRLQDAGDTLGMLAVDCRRFVLARMTGNTPVVERIGTGYLSLDPIWVHSAVGRPVYEQPDAIYGCYVAESFLKADRAHEPVLELVDAEIRAPDRAPLRLRYERLLLPWIGSGASFVSSLSAVRTSLSAEIADM